ncbi:MAG: LTA synthase family protein [Bacillaceae bacterium]|nr:LTA synthase family protein [Bacillaceae bacterium]
MIKLIKNGIVILLLLASLVIASAAQYYAVLYENSSLDEVIFYLNTGLEGADLSVITNFFIDQWMVLLLTLIIVFAPIFTLTKNNYYIALAIKQKKITLNFFPLVKSYKFKLAYAISIFIASILFSYHAIGINAYLKQLYDYSTFMEEEYVDPRDVTITFPDEKRNLIIIYLESMETTMMSKENNGGWHYSVMPELENIALENINFSNTYSLGGPFPTSGTTWTIAGLVSTTSGLPLKIPIGGNEYTSESFLSGAVALGDILEVEGYNLGFMFGSDASFGGRYQYFTKHGGYNIFDLNTALERNLMTPEEEVFWGFEDGKLFEWAKQELIDLAKEDKPFNFNLLTVNTHFPDGYLEKEAEEIHPTKYENVHAYASKQVSNFIDWLKEQDFYSNTTIVLIGDHNSMKSVDYYESRIVSEDFERVTYNAIINSPIEPINEKQRVFSNLDMFPTMLASMGVEIEGDKLGLGTNLYSTESTLFEKFGIDYVNEELNKNSVFYNTKMLQGDYVDLINSTN